MEISVVVPAYNEEESIVHSVNVIDEVVSTLTKDYELVIVNDGSIDDTRTLLLLLARENPHIRIIDFSSNRGHMAAIDAGLKNCRGNYIVTIDADLQDDPKDILEMYRIIQEKDLHGNALYDVIQTVRTTRVTDNFLKKYSAKIYYVVIGKLTGIPIAHHAADFRMLTKTTNNLLCNLPETRKIYRLLIPALGFKVYNLETTRHKRFAGKSKYPLSKMIQLALNSLLDFSTTPLRIMIKIGFISTVFMFTFGITAFVLWLNGSTIPGWTSLVFLVLTSNSLVLLSLGVIGLYVGNLNEQVKRRPNGIWQEIIVKPSRKSKPTRGLRKSQ